MKAQITIQYNRKTWQRIRQLLKIRRKLVNEELEEEIRNLRQELTTWKIESHNENTTREFKIKYLKYARGKGQFNQKAQLELIMNPSLYDYSYRMQRSKASAWTPAWTKPFPTGIQKTWFMELTEAIRLDLWRPSCARRIMIPKANGKFRPLTIGTLEDKIVQQAVLQIIEPVLDRALDGRVIGFRPNKGTRDAWSQLATRQWQECEEVIEGDIKGCFDNISHERLKRQLEDSKIFNTQVLKQINHLQASPYKEEGGKEIIPERGTPQGSVISPTLSNQFLRQQDEWVMETPEFKENRIEYMRYADDFIIGQKNGVNGKDLMQRLNSYMQMIDLPLSEEKTVLTKTSTGFKFLGTKIIINNGISFIGKLSETNEMEPLNLMKILRGQVEYQRHCDNQDSIIAAANDQITKIIESKYPNRKRIDWLGIIRQYEILSGERLVARAEEKMSYSIGELKERMKPSCYYNSNFYNQELSVKQNAYQRWDNTPNQTYYCWECLTNQANAQIHIYRISRNSSYFRTFGIRNLPLCQLCYSNRKVRIECSHQNLTR